MAEERPWTDADRELVARAWRSTSAVRLDGIEMMISDAMRAADVLDALTAAGKLIDRPPGCACPSAGLMVQPGCPAHAYRGGTEDA